METSSQNNSITVENQKSIIRTPLKLPVPTNKETDIKKENFLTSTPVNKNDNNKKISITEKDEMFESKIVMQQQQQQQESDKNDNSKKIFFF